MGSRINMFEEDISRQLVEWIEFNKLFGASKIVLYIYQVHTNISKVLRFYQSEGLVQIVHWPFPEFRMSINPRDFLIQNP